MKVDLREVLSLPYPVPNNNDNGTSNSNDNGTDNNSGHMALPLDSNGFHTYTNQQLAHSATEKLLMYCATYSMAIISALMSPSNSRILRMQCVRKRLGPLFHASSKSAPPIP
jgi:hypothetical protein